MGKSELFLYGLFLVGYLLFNYIVKQAAKRAQQQRESEPQEETAPPPEGESLEDLWGPRPKADLPTAAAPVEPVRRVESTPAEPAPAPPRAVRSSLFRSSQDLRHAIVVMTVLGPCRALAPHDRS